MCSVSALGSVILTAFITAVMGVFVLEFYQTTPWLADKLMQWSVRVRYADNPERAKVREEELTGLLDDLPTLFKFPTAGWFFLHALAYRFGRGRSLGGIPTDQVLKLRMRRHWALLFAASLQTIWLMIGVFSLSWLISSVGADLWLLQLLLCSIAAVTVLRLAWRALEWWIEVIVVTDKQFMFTYGVIRRKIHMTLLTELTDVRLDELRPVAGRLLGYGTIRMKSVTGNQVLELLGFMPRPEEVFRTLTELVSDEKPGSGVHNGWT
jgi:PH (Pleckstrin Homology) domain-containing protein